jgi:hypothetical protein
MTEDSKVNPIALGIHVHRILTEKKQIAWSLDEITFQIARELDFNYTFYYKRGKPSEG